MRRREDAIAQYGQAIREKALALGARDDTVEAQENDLWKTLAVARDAQARHVEIAGQISEKKSLLEASQATYAKDAQELEGIVRFAKVETVEELEPLLANLESRSKALSQMSMLRGTLSGLARGQTVDDFITRLETEDVDAFPQKKTSLQSQKAEKEAELKSIGDTVYALKTQKQAFEAAGDAAANYRQQAESCAARVKQDALRFVHLRLAAYFLQAQIERFRKENQAPLLEKSGQVFQSITCCAFSGLSADFNADDTPVMVGLRKNQSSVPIAGMSDGSRDQLYLALRLAALNQYLDKHEPMPLILDDLLITFDDERAVAILPQLATLAQRTQIFLFTHHEHLVGLCDKTLDKVNFHLHRL